MLNSCSTYSEVSSSRLKKPMVKSLRIQVMGINLRSIRRTTFHMSIDGLRFENSFTEISEYRTALQLIIVYSPNSHVSLVKLILKMVLFYET